MDRSLLSKLVNSDASDKAQRHAVSTTRTWPIPPVGNATLLRRCRQQGYFGAERRHSRSCSPIRPCMRTPGCTCTSSCFGLAEIKIHNQQHHQLSSGNTTNQSRFIHSFIPSEQILPTYKETSFFCFYLSCSPEFSSTSLSSVHTPWPFISKCSGLSTPRGG